jgi:hypothetical protein
VNARITARTASQRPTATKALSLIVRRLPIGPSLQRIRVLVRDGQRLPSPRLTNKSFLGYYGDLVLLPALR